MKLGRSMPLLSRLSDRIYEVAYARLQIAQDVERSGIAFNATTSSIFASLAPLRLRLVRLGQLVEPAAYSFQLPLPG